MTIMDVMNIYLGSSTGLPACLPGGGDFVKETDSYCFKDYEKIVLIAPPKNN